MTIEKTEIEGVLILRPNIYKDSRGYFFETFSEKEFHEKVGYIHFVQDNESYSSFGVIRGLHFQAPPYAQAKLVRCTEGKVLDIALDIRKDSISYGKYVAVELSGENHLQLFIPRGFAHGFIVLSEHARFSYKCDNYYVPQSEGGIFILDKSLNLDFILSQSEIIISDKDKKYPLLSNFISPFYSL